MHAAIQTVGAIEPAFCQDGSREYGSGLAFPPCTGERIGTGLGMFQWLMIRHDESWRHRLANAHPAQGWFSSISLQASLIDVLRGPGLPM